MVWTADSTFIKQQRIGSGDQIQATVALIPFLLLPFSQDTPSDEAPLLILMLPCDIYDICINKIDGTDGMLNAGNQASPKQTRQVIVKLYNQESTLNVLVAMW